MIYQRLSSCFIYTLNFFMDLFRQHPTNKLIYNKIIRVLNDTYIPEIDFSKRLISYTNFMTKYMFRLC